MKLVPLVEMLSKTGIQERHWSSIEKILNTSFDSKTITIRDLLRYHVDQFLDTIEEISDIAVKEYGLENAVVKMEKEWENMRFVLGKWKKRDITVF